MRLSATKRNEIWNMNTDQRMLLFQGIVALGAIGWMVDWGMSHWKNRPSQSLRNLESDIAKALTAVDSTQRVFSHTRNASEIRPFFQNDISPVFSKLKELDIRPKVEEPLWFADDNLERTNFMVTQWLFTEFCLFCQISPDKGETSMNITAAGKARNGAALLEEAVLAALAELDSPLRASQIRDKLNFPKNRSNALLRAVLHLMAEDGKVVQISPKGPWKITDASNFEERD